MKQKYKTFIIGQDLETLVWNIRGSYLKLKAISVAVTIKGE